MSASVEHAGMGGAVHRNLRPPRAAAAGVSVDSGTDAAGKDQPSARIEQQRAEVRAVAFRLIEQIDPLIYFQSGGQHHGRGIGNGRGGRRVPADRRE